MSTEGGQIVSQNEKLMDSTSTTILRLRFVRVEVDVAWHEIVVRPGPVSTYGTTSGLTSGRSPKLGSIDDLFRHFLECFTDSDRSLC